MNVQEVFKRYEKKYLLEAKQYKSLLTVLDHKITADIYGKHTICNIYFDTDDYQLIRTSLGKPVYKEKLRLRSYGTPEDTDTVFVELKKKYDGVVYKRRISMTLKEARSYLYENRYPEKESQILREIDYVKSRYHLVPAVYLSYDRIAYYGNEDNNFRLTFDQNILCRQDFMDLQCGSGGIALLKPGQVLMEVKIPGTMPLWMSHILTELKIYPVSYSKYGTYYQNYLSQMKRKEQIQNEEKYTGGKICA